MATNYEWGAGEMEDSFESLGEQEAYGGNGEASYYEQERNGTQSSIYGEAEGGYTQPEHEAESVFDETQEMELAADMLSLGSEMELDQAIGKLMHSAASAVGGSISRDVGMALGSAIKAAAQQAAPISGTPSSASGELFGIETEGLSGEDQEFEIMRRFVRFAGAAAGRAARGPRGINPRSIVRSALFRAARRWAPGLLRRWSRGLRRGPDWNRRRWLARQQRWGGAPGYGYGYPSYQTPYPPQPGMPGTQQQPPSPFEPGGGGGFGGGQDQSGGAMGQGMPDAGGAQDSGGGPEGPIPQTGRWTRQGGQLTIHL